MESRHFDKNNQVTGFLIFYGNRNFLVLYKLINPNYHVVSFD